MRKAQRELRSATPQRADLKTAGRYFADGPQPGVPPIIVAVADLSRVGRRLFGLRARYGAAQPPRNDGRADGATEARAMADPSLTPEPSVTNNLRAN